MNNNSDWRPDWTIDTHYPDESASMKKWAWEFLRRNKSYQSDYGKIGIIPSEEFELKETDQSMDLFVCEPPALPGETAQQWEDRVDKMFRDRKLRKASRKPLIDIVAEKYGLQVWLPPPQYSYEELGMKLRFCSPYLDHLMPLVKESKMESMIPELGEAVIKFNLAYPIKTQLERAKRILEGGASFLDKEGELDRIKRRYHVRKFQTYLRVLDGECSGATVRDMAEVICPGKNSYPDYLGDKDISNALKAAKKIRDQDYVYLPHS